MPLVRAHLFITYVKFSQKLTVLPLIQTHACAYQGVRNVSVQENVVWVLNGLSVKKQMPYPISGWWDGSSKQHGQWE